MSPMSILEPVCTCAVPGINGCAKHTYGGYNDPDPVKATAARIAGGEAFTDGDAIVVAQAFLARTGS